jgi:hypothetical protein
LVRAPAADSCLFDRLSRPPEVAVRKKWLLTFVLCVGFGLLLLAWLATEDARQAALLDIRVLEAENRALRLRSRLLWESQQEGIRPIESRVPEWNREQAAREIDEAWEEFQTLRLEQQRRQDSWHVRLRREVRRRTGW